MKLAGFLMVQKPLMCQKIKANFISHVMTPLNVEKLFVSH